MAENNNTPPMFPQPADNPLYPDSCKRLRADNTYVEVTYTIEGGTQMLSLLHGRQRRVPGD